MDSYSFIRLFHIAVGSAALLTGPIAMMNQNGGKLHRISGSIYFWCMQAIVVTSFYMSFVKGSLFLFMIAGFTFYLITTGVRALKLKKLHLGQKPESVDWLILILSGIFGLSLVILGIYTLLVSKNSFGIVPIVFGYFMTSGVYKDYKRFTVPPKEKNHWLFTHISGMIGGYIATVTAFLVNNIHTEPAFISWIAPSIIFVPFTIYTINKFKSKSKKLEPIKFEKGTY